MKTVLAAMLFTGAIWASLPGAAAYAQTCTCLTMQGDTLRGYLQRATPIGAHMYFRDVFDNSRDIDSTIFYGDIKLFVSKPPVWKYAGLGALTGVIAGYGAGLWASINESKHDEIYRMNSSFVKYFIIPALTGIVGSAIGMIVGWMIGLRKSDVRVEINGSLDAYNAGLPELRHLQLQNE